MITGGCQCGEVRYEIDAPGERHALCHCADCRRSAGAPAVAWMAVPEAQFRVTNGSARGFNSSGKSIRYFCPTCGTGLYFLNEEMLPGIVDIQSATFDDAASHPPGAQIQCAERLGYMAKLAEMPTFERWPGG